MIVNCLFIGPDEIDAEAQAKVIQDLIDGGNIDGISMSVIDEAIAAEVIDSAIAANIHIITFDSDAPDTQREAYVGTDNIALGKELGMLLLTRFATSGTYAILSGESPNLIKRKEGIRKSLKGSGWSEVEGSPTNFDGSSSLAIEQMNGLMKQHPDLTAIISTAGRPMRGLDGKWEEFAEQYPDVILFSADNMPEQMDLLNRGFADGLVGQQPADMGAKSIDTLLALSKGNDVDDFVATDLVVLARVNRGNPYNPLELSYANAASVMSCSFASLLLLLACTVGVFLRF